MGSSSEPPTSMKRSVRAGCRTTRRWCRILTRPRASSGASLCFIATSALNACLPRKPHENSSRLSDRRPHQGDWRWPERQAGRKGEGARGEARGAEQINDGGNLGPWILGGLSRPDPRRVEYPTEEIPLPAHVPVRSVSVDARWRAHS